MGVSGIVEQNLMQRVKYLGLGIEFASLKISEFIQSYEWQKT